MIGPLVAPGGIVKSTSPSDTLVGTVTMLPIRTPIVPVRFEPKICTGVPTGPLVTAPSELMDGGAEIVSEVVAFPPGVVIWTVWGVPVVAPVGTVKVSLISDTAVNGQLTPPSVTCEAPVRFEPLTVTVECTAAVLEPRLLIDGGP